MDEQKIESSSLFSDFCLSTTDFNIKQNPDELITSKGTFKDWFSTLTDEDFERTTIGYGEDNFIDLEQRSSWTCKQKIEIYNHDVDKQITFKLIKYCPGDFFTLHKDSQGTHTCLIFCPSKFKGGVLTLKKNDLCEINISPEVMKQQLPPLDFYTTVTFSVDFLHKVSPITEGVRYVLKGWWDDTEGEEYDDYVGYLDCAAGGDY